MQIKTLAKTRDTTDYVVICSDSTGYAIEPKSDVARFLKAMHAEFGDEGLIGLLPKWGADYKAGTPKGDRKNNG